MASALQTAGLARLFEFLADRHGLLSIRLDADDPASAVGVPKSFAAAWHEPDAATLVAIAGHWDQKTIDQQEQYVRNASSADEFARFMAQGLSAVQVTLYRSLGLLVAQLGEHQKALGAAAAGNATLMKWVTNGDTTAPEFTAAASTVKSLLEGTDDDARIALRAYDPQILPHGVTQQHANVCYVSSRCE